MVRPRVTAASVKSEEPLFVLDGRCVEFPEGLRTADFTHTIHRFPGKFVPQVACELLKLVGASRKTLIADPFCGSGTSLVEGSLAGVPTIGVDFDPLAVFMSRAKTTALSMSQIADLRKFWVGKIGSASHKELSAAVPNLDHWFKPEFAKQLAFLKRKALRIEDEQQRVFSLVVLSSVIRRVSNADDQTQKTYVSGTLRKTPPRPDVLFPAFMEKALRGMDNYSGAARAPVVLERGDARTWLSAKKLDGIITSPPYIDSIDYVYNQMLEYFWLHEELGLDSLESVRELRKEPVGFRREDVAAGLEQLSEISQRAVDLLEPRLSEIQKASPKEAQHVVGYFTDFAQHLRMAKRNLKPGAPYALVVGESYIRGVTVPTPAILSELFTGLGFADMGGCSYVIKRHYMKFPRRSNSGKINIDFVRCFKSS